MCVKLRIRDRILSAVMGLIICGGSVCALLYALRTPLSGWQLLVAVCVCIVLCYIGLCGIALLFRRRKEKGVVMQHTEFGDVSISMKAMENMVRKCVDAHPELNVNQTRISHSRSGVSVDIKITLMTGSNIPLTVNALQKQVKQYITSCSGVDVEEVRVMVETEAAKHLPAPEAVEMAEEKPAQEEAPQPPVVEKAAECLCQHQEEPDTYVEKPAEAEKEIQASEPDGEPETEEASLDTAEETDENAEEVEG